MYFRNLEFAIDDTLADTPVVFLAGARQTGKSTLAQELARRRGGSFVSMDAATMRDAALADPEGFLRELADFAVIDEAQLAPGLFRAAKLLVDENRRPGRFLMTGSADLTHLPKVAESLAGRMETLALMPLSQGEIAGRRDSFVENIFAGASPALERADAGPPLWTRIFRGGFPEAAGRVNPRRRAAWFENYIANVVERDLREVADLARLGDTARLLRLLAGRLGGLMNMAEVSRTAAMPQTTLRRHLAALRATFLFAPLPAWSSNLGKRLVRAPKIHLADSGLAAHLLGLEGDAPAAAGEFAGPLLENFALGELRKQAEWAGRRIDLYYFRTAGGREVDIVLEDPRGQIVGVEVKAAASVGWSDFKGLRELKREAGPRFVRGAVLHAGADCAPFGDGLWALPVDALWEPWATDIKRKQSHSAAPRPSARRPRPR